MKRYYLLPLLLLLTTCGRTAPIPIPNPPMSGGVGIDAQGGVHVGVETTFRGIVLPFASSTLTHPIPEGYTTFSFTSGSLKIIPLRGQSYTQALVLVYFETEGGGRAPAYSWIIATSGGAVVTIPLEVPDEELTYPLNGATRIRIWIQQQGEIEITNVEPQFTGRLQ